MARSNNSATREFCHVILSEAKDLGKLGRFFAALRIDRRRSATQFFWNGPYIS